MPFYFTFSFCRRYGKTTKRIYVFNRTFSRLLVVQSGEKKFYREVEKSIKSEMMATIKLFIKVKSQQNFCQFKWDCMEIHRRRYILTIEFTNMQTQ